MKRIAIVGLGQIGGSIVLTLRKNDAPYHITGVDVSRKRLRLLQNSLDSAGTNSKGISDADLVILCLHYADTLNYLASAPQDQLFTDVCSGKLKLMQLANRKRLRFVGGHPLVGNEFEQEKGWRADLFENATYFLCPGKHSSQKDLQQVRQFVRQLRGRPVLIDPSMHDRHLAITSHFPAFVSGLIYDMGSKIPSEFKGPGFRSMTRLAKSSPALLKTFVQSNRENLKKTAHQMRSDLEKLIRKLKA
jgi:prephenate dehydrogenase